MSRRNQKTNPGGVRRPSGARRRGIGTILACVAIAVVVGGVGGVLIFNDRNNDDKSNKADAARLLDEGIAAQTAGDLTTAAARFNEVIKNDRQNKIAYYDLALIQQRQNQTAQAETNYREAIRIDPAYAPALYNLGIIRSNAGSKDEAVDLYTRATVADPQSARAFLNLGLLLNSMGKGAEGKAALEKAVQLEPDLASRIPTGQKP